MQAVPSGHGQSQGLATWSQLVSELDERLGVRSPAPAYLDEAVAVRRRYTFGLPALVPLVAVALIVVAISFLAVQPWQQRCDLGPDLCRIERLDIDAVRVTVPNSALIETLPSIDVLDPDDVLTVGDVFRIERFSDIEWTRLLTPAEIERLVNPAS